MSKSITRQQFKDLLNGDAFGELFIALGWDAPQSQPLPIKLDERILTATVVAEKRGFAVLVVRTKEPLTKPERHKVERKVARSYFEHLVIFHAESGQQVWQLAIRRPNQPITFHETTWHKGQEPELLYQKLSGLFIPLAEEDKITLVDVRERVTREFEKQTKDVTKKFYAGFKQEHDRFLKFIEGLNDQDARKWYASLMLNRLMFIYFMQRKGFMNEDKHYLRNKLEETRKLEGKDKFYGFYRDFLRELFHQGLGKHERTPELIARIGRVPYLNGGLFDLHPLEKDNPKIQIKDEAFKKLFAFFDEWQWTLDTRQHASGKEVNPDVIGYIFEQYINDRAQMGAYYTKEDITEYIAKNTIIPWLFDAAKAKDAQAFKPEGGVWELLRNDPDRYIHESVQRGITDEVKDLLDEEMRGEGGSGGKGGGSLPWWKSCLFDDLGKELRAGLNPEQKDLVAKRKCWNRTADADKALPTEIWREVIERRRRYLEVRRKLVAGEVTAINDLITYNLDIRQFAQDVLHEHESGDLVWAFYDAIQHVTVLDPTCGSGAFLFAALGILQPLYEECLQRMAEFREQAKNEGKPKRWQQFQPILDRIAKHHDDNRAYFIYKSIILQNLYGVDIMPEAVEIAKLRLFLKLVSTVEPDPKHPGGSYGIEPLPDIDFNIRAGNTLVGFGTRQDVKDITKQTFDFDEEEREKVEEQSEQVDMVYERWKAAQLEYGPGGAGDTHDLKKELQKRTAELNNKLDAYLAKWYQITDVKKQAKQFEAWKQSHKPFHWFTQYYGIINKRGGFDVIIGNPPYVEYTPQFQAKEYQAVGYTTAACGDLYALVTERCTRLRSKHGGLGLIVPISIFCTDGFAPLQKLCWQQLGMRWISTYSNRPAQVFEGAQKRVTILLARDKEPSGQEMTWTSGYHRWKGEERDALMKAKLSYIDRPRFGKFQAASVEKLGSATELSAFEKVVAKSHPLAAAIRTTSQFPIYYTRKFSYFLLFLNRVPKIKRLDTGKAVPPSELKDLFFSTETAQQAALGVLSSSTFFWFWNTLSDCRNLNRRDLHTFPFNPETVDAGSQKAFAKLGQRYLQALDQNASQMTKSGLSIESFDIPVAKPILDEIDTLLAGHYGLSAEELDFVINYDIKYRMGEELEGEE